MSKFQLSEGKINEPEFFLLYGVEGIGKTTFASNAPKPSIVDIEDGSKQIEGVKRISGSQLKSTKDVVEAIGYLATTDTETIIVDSASRLEKIIWGEVARDHKKSSIEDIGYAKGYIYALEYWEMLLNACRSAQMAGKNVIIIAHNHQKTHNDPTLIEGYQRYELELHHKAASLLKKNVDAIYFANYKILVKDGKGLDTGERCLYTERRAGHDAKNRFGLPYEINLNWSDYIQAKSGSVLDKESLTRQIEGLLPEVSNEETRNKIIESLKGDLSIAELQAYLKRVETIIGAVE